MARSTYERLGPDLYAMEIFQLMLREGSPKLALAFATRHKLRSSAVEPVLSPFPVKGWSAPMAKLLHKEAERDAEAARIEVRRQALYGFSSSL